MYIQDYDQKWVDYGQLQTGNAAPQGSGIPALLWPYVKNYQIFNCPSTMKAQMEGASPAVPGYIMSTHASIADYNGNDDVGSGVQDQISYPAECATIFDDRNDSTTQGWGDPSCEWINRSGYNNRGPAQYSQCPHNQGVNIGYLDGHAAFMTFDATQNMQNMVGGYGTAVTTAQRHFWYGID